MKYELRFTPTPTNHFQVWFNSACLGDVYQEVDGFYVYWPRGTGYWEAWIMRAIADKLDELNKPWQEQIDKDLNEILKSKPKDIEWH